MMKNAEEAKLNTPELDKTNTPEQKEKARKHIRSNYAKIALGKTQTGCCATGCGCSEPQGDITDVSRQLGYQGSDLEAIPDGANMGLGCGNPFAIANLQQGDVVLDLGSGGGFDCFLASRQVGEEGHVIGVDMTPEMVSKARLNAEKIGNTNVEFRLGEIENLPVADESVNVIISNCVVNMSMDKQRVFKEAHRVLKKGGKFAISDIVATAELPAELKEDLRGLSGCYAGAEYVGVIEQMLQTAGFTKVSLTPKDNSKEILQSWQPGKQIENYVASYYIEAVK